LYKVSDEQYGIGLVPMLGVGIHSFIIKAIERLKKGQLMEPWYLSYAILGCTMGGMIPILIPLLAFS
jgi:hypothetical protein